MTPLQIAWLQPTWANATVYCKDDHGYYCDWYKALATRTDVRMKVGPSARGADLALLPYHCTANVGALPACLLLARDTGRIAIIVNKVFEGMNEKVRILQGVQDRIVMLAMASPIVYRIAEKMRVRPLFLPYGVDRAFEAYANSEMPYRYDVGFTGGWQRFSARYALRKDCWSRNVTSLLQAKGARLLTGGYLPRDKYIRTIAESKIWFSTTERGDHVTTRALEVLASGRAMLMIDRNHAALKPLGIVEGVHAAMFSSAAEYMQLVAYYMKDEKTRLCIVRRGHELAIRRHLWSARAAQFVETAKQVVHSDVTERKSTTMGIRRESAP